MLALPVEQRGELPVDQRPLRAREQHPRQDEELGTPKTRDFQHSLDSVRTAYAGGLSPTHAVEHAFAQAQRLAESSPSMTPMQSEDLTGALEAATAAETRLRDGNARALEGTTGTKHHDERATIKYHPNKSSGQRISGRQAAASQLKRP